MVLILNIIEKAFQFALTKHEGQFRRGTDIPYITHPFSVGMILKHHQYSDKVVAAGILHDTLEDTETTEKELLEDFGKEVLELIQAASEEDKTLSWKKRKRQMTDELSLKTQDQLAIIVANKLHNIRSIQDDVALIGETIWEKFNRGKRGQSWYYMSIVNTLNHVAKEMELIHILDAEVKRLFVGTDKLTNKKIDLIFDEVYLSSLNNKEKFEELGMLEFVSQLKTDADSFYRNQSFDPLSPLMRDFMERDIEFEYNSDGTFILLAFCNELQYRLGWSNDELYRHFKRNLKKL